MAETTRKEIKKTTSEPAEKKVVKKSPAKPATVKKTVVKKVAAPRKATKTAPVKIGIVINEEQRYRMIAEAAYYRAESCNFKSDPIRDWIEAERDIAILLSEKE